jgi:hypothetical protein
MLLAVLLFIFVAVPAIAAALAAWRRLCDTLPRSNEDFGLWPPADPLARRDPPCLRGGRDHLLRTFL